MLDHRPPPVPPRRRLGRKGWLAIAAAILAVGALVVLRPDPPSPAGTVKDYFGHLGSGDTDAALALVDTTGAAPLLVPAALASAENRPSDLKVLSSQPYEGNDRYTVVKTRYQAGGHAIEQAFAVVTTGDDKTPYRLEEPFLSLVVDLPSGLDVAVNGVTVDAAEVSGGTPAFPGAYQATTRGNALFAGATQAATYDTGYQGETADIDLTRLTAAPGAAEAVQSALQSYLDANCVAGQNCPLRAPSVSWYQTTGWTVTAYPKVQLSSADAGQAQVRFTTATPGSASYTTSYTEFGGATKTETGVVPIDLSGTAAVRDDGAVGITLDY